MKKARETLEALGLWKRKGVWENTKEKEKENLKSKTKGIYVSGMDRFSRSDFSG